MFKLAMIAGVGLAAYWLVKPTYANHCLTGINPFVAGPNAEWSWSALNPFASVRPGVPWSWCPGGAGVAGSATNVAGANMPIRSGHTDTDVAGLNSNRS